MWLPEENFLSKSTIPLKCWAVETQEARPSAGQLTGGCFQMGWRFSPQGRWRAKRNWPADTDLEECDIIKTVFSFKGVYSADEP